MKELYKSCEKIKSHPDFLTAIQLHYKINMDIYHKQPLFYKTMLQESRFNILLATLCFIFGQRIACVSDIKELCARYRIASPNRVIAILTLLRTTGRVQTRRDGDDRRRVILGPTEKGVEELKYYLRGTLEPLGGFVE